METSARLVLDVGLVLLLAAGAGWAARRIGLPAIVGYLAAGLAVSPFTPGYVANREQITFLADVGVVLLLFEVGIEVDLGRIRREARSLLALAPLQVVLTTAIGWAAFGATGSPPLGAALLGLSVALSSSVVVVNITRSRRRTTDQPTERVSAGPSSRTSPASRWRRSSWRSSGSTGAPRPRRSAAWPSSRSWRSGPPGSCP